MDARTFRTLALTGLAAGAAALIPASPLAGTGAWHQFATGIATIALTATGGYLTNRASSHRDQALASASARQGASLRAAMSQALRKALTEHRPRLPETAAWNARFSAWDSNLALAQTSRETLDLFLPPVLAEDLWDASNPYSPDAGHDEIQALATLLRNWLTTGLRTSKHFTAAEAESLAGAILPAWRTAFAELVAADTSGFLFQAFTVEGINHLRTQVAKLQSGTAEAIRALLDEIRQALPTQPTGLSIPLLLWNPGLPPAAPLRTQYRIVPFHPVRKPELDNLIHWAASTDPFRARLYTGPGGAGKTRLALEACLSLSASHDFAAGFLSRDLPDDDVQRLLEWAARTRAGLLAVVDYAETDQRTVASLVSHAAAMSFPIPIRLVLLARGRGMWWRRLQNASGGVGDLLSGSSTESAEPTALALIPDVRPDVFQSAAAAFQTCLALPPAPVVAPDLSDPAYSRFLAIHLAALVAVGGEPVPAPHEIARRIVGREIDSLERVLNRRLSAPYGECADVVLKVFTALEGASGPDEAVSILSRIPELEGEKPVVLIAIADTMHDLYQGTRWIDPLQPDLLAESAVADLARERPRLLARLARPKT